MYGSFPSGPSRGPAAQYGTQAPYGVEIGYGGAPSQLQKASTPPLKHRGRVSASTVLVCLLAPCVLFAAVGAALSLPLRRESPALSFIVVIAAGLIALASAYSGAATAYRRWAGQTLREPFWYVFLGATMPAAWFSAYWLGELNWANNVVPYLELQTLDVRGGVDPSTAVGQQLMDVGRVTFAEGSKVDGARSMGFKNVETYCVAPIVRGNATPATFDFWAIGLDCCTSGAHPAFQCGDYDKPGARGGLRIVRADQRAFYMLAVQQAEATYGVRARHPLFFFWMDDPAAELESYKADGYKTLLVGTVSFFALQLFLVLGGVVTFAKL
mmetsp:Transcript_20760/g.59300  ORF Transcript_20760/g.59300 Transcript_20760/m.59300 type:complete len:327 (+) Transcript_20760:137-1117(+)